MSSQVKVRLARRVGTRLLSATLLGSLSLPLVATSLSVQAASAQQVSFTIPAGSLATALAAFGRQSGLQVSYLPEYAAGKTSPGITATTTPADALGRLLQGSGLHGSFTDASTVTLTRADSSTVADDGALTLGTITVNAKAGGMPADAPYENAGSRAYLSGEQVDRFRGTSVGDFLSGVPGVLNGDARNSGALDVNIRGMQGQGRVPVIVDGSSQETTIYQGYNGSNSRSYIDPDFIGSVEIEKGASMGSDATGAVGGVVRISTIGVQDILLPGESLGVRLKGGFNGNSSARPAEGTQVGFRKGNSYYGTMPSEDEQYYPRNGKRPGLLEATGGSGSIAVAGSNEYLDAVAAYARRYNGNYYAGKKGGDDARPGIEADRYGNLKVVNVGLSPYRAGEQVVNTSLDNESWLLKAKLRMINDQTLELGYSKYISDYGYQLGSTYFVAEPYQGELSNITLDTWTARYRWQPADSDWFNVKVDSFYNKVDNRANATNWFSTGLVSAAMLVGAERWGSTASNTSLFTTDYGDLSVEYGGGFTRETVGNPDGLTYDSPGFVKPQPREGNRTESNGFTTVQWKPQEWLTLDGNLRYSHYETVDNAPTLEAPYERTDKGWSRIVSVTVEPYEGLKPYLKYSNVMRNPSIFESLTSPSFGVPVADNPVKPEQVRSYEAGVNFLRDGVLMKEDKLRLHAAYFDNKTDNYITRSNIPMVTPWFTWYALGRVNLKSAEMRGFEVSGEYDTGKVFGSIAWNHYTHVMFCAEPGTINPDYTQCAAGGLYNSFSQQQVPPKDTVTFNLGSRFLDNKLTIGSRLNWIGSRYTIGIGDGSEATTQSLGVSSIQASRWNPYALVDLYASYELNKNASFDLNIDNLTDRFYIDALSIMPVPGPGRTLRGSFTLKF